MPSELLNKKDEDKDASATLQVNISDKYFSLVIGILLCRI
jgi:hypothetical protein